MLHPGNESSITLLKRNSLNYEKNLDSAVVYKLTHSVGKTEH